MWFASPHSGSQLAACLAGVSYTDTFDHLWSLTERGVIWVTRAKENLQFTVLASYPVKADGAIVSDELVGLANAGSRKAYPELMRRVVAWVEVDGQKRLMTVSVKRATGWGLAGVD